MNFYITKYHKQCKTAHNYLSFCEAGDQEWLSWVIYLRVSQNAAFKVSAKDGGLIWRINWRRISFKLVVDGRILDWWPQFLVIQASPIWQLVSIEHTSGQNREFASKTEVTVSCNLIMEMTSYHLCCIPVVRNNSLGQSTGYSREEDYMKTCITWGGYCGDSRLFRSLPQSTWRASRKSEEMIFFKDGQLGTNSALFCQRR